MSEILVDRNLGSGIDPDGSNPWFHREFDRLAKEIKETTSPIDMRQHRPAANPTTERTVLLRRPQLNADHLAINTQTPRPIAPDITVDTIPQDPPTVMLRYHIPAADDETTPLYLPGKARIRPETSPAAPNPNGPIVWDGHAAPEQDPESERPRTSQERLANLLKRLFEENDPLLQELLQLINKKLVAKTALAETVILPNQHAEPTAQMPDPESRHGQFLHADQRAQIGPNGELKIIDPFEPKAETPEAGRHRAPKSRLLGRIASILSLKPRPTGRHSVAQIPAQTGRHRASKRRA